MGGRRRQRRASELPSGGITGHRGRSIAVVLVVAAALVATLFALRGARIARLRAEIAALEARHAAASAERILLEEQLAAASDPETIEALARLWLGWVMPGEEKAIFIREE